MYDSRSKKVPFLIVRGVSDFVNDIEGKQIRERWKKKAAKHAAEFVCKIVCKIANKYTSIYGSSKYTNTKY